MRSILSAVMVVSLLSIPFSLRASPATKAMLDGNGCHTCNQVCTKFGVQRGQFHCHVFAPEAWEIWTRAQSLAAANDEKMYAANVLQALDYISLSSDKGQLLIGPTEKRQIEGQYKVVSHSCGYGIKPVTLTRGKSSAVRKVFGVPLSSQLEGLYSLGIENRSFVAIIASNNHLLAVDLQDKIICGGQFVKEKLFLFCQGSAINPKTSGTSGYCRTSLIKQ